MQGTTYESETYQPFHNMHQVQNDHPKQIREVTGQFKEQSWLTLSKHVATF